MSYNHISSHGHGHGHGDYYTIYVHSPKQTLGWKVYRETMGWLAALAIVAGLLGGLWLVEILFGGG